MKIVFSKKKLLESCLKVQEGNNFLVLKQEIAPCARLGDHFSSFIAKTVHLKQCVTIFV